MRRVPWNPLQAGDAANGVKCDVTRAHAESACRQRVTILVQHDTTERRKQHQHGIYRRAETGVDERREQD